MASESRSGRIVIKKETGPKKAPPKADRSGKPPGSTLLKNEGKSTRKS